MQNIKAISLFLAVQLPKEQVKGIMSLIGTQFLTFLIIVHKNKCRFWNAETKLNNIGIFRKNGIWKFDLI